MKKRKMNLNKMFKNRYKSINNQKHFTKVKLINNKIQLMKRKKKYKKMKQKY